MARPRWQEPSLLKSKTKRPYWYLWIYQDARTETGRKRTHNRHRLGYCHEMNKEQAKQARAVFLKRVNQERMQVHSHVPLSRFVHIWMARHVVALSEGTKRKYESHLRKYILPKFGDARLCDLETGKLQDWLNGLVTGGGKGKQPRPLAWATKVDIRNILSAIFAKADEWGYWETRNPAKYLSAGKKRTARKQFILADDAVRLIQGGCPPFLVLLINLLRATGLRVSEALGLQERHVDGDWLNVDQRWYRGDLDVTKNEKSTRPVPLAGVDLSGLLTGDGEHFLFDRGDGRPWDDRDLMRRWIRPAAKAAGCYFPGLGFHSFRREVATRLQELGASAIETAEWLGHTRPVMTQRYTVLQRSRMETLAKGLKRAEVVEFPVADAE